MIKRRKWKCAAAWMLCVVLCAGNMQVSASGTNGTEAGTADKADKTDVSAAAMDKTDPANGETDTAGGKPDSGSGETDTADGKPDSGSGETDTAGGKPDSGSGETDTADGKPDSGSGETDAGSGDTDPAGGKPDSGAGETDAGSADTDPAGGETDLAEDGNADFSAARSLEDTYGDTGTEAKMSGAEGSGSEAVPNQAQEYAPAMNSADGANETLPTEGDEAEPSRVLLRGNTDYVLPDRVEIVYGQHLWSAEDALNEACSDGSFFFYDYDNNIKTVREARENDASNIIPEETGDTDRYGIWFVPDDGTEGAGRRVTVTVLPKPVTIEINDVSRVYGDAAAAYTYDQDAARSQLAFEDEGLEDLAITLTAQDDDGNIVTEKTPAGTYLITGTDTSRNYDITFRTGKLTVTPKEAELLWSGYENLTYDPDGNANVTASVSNLIDGDTCNVTVDNGTNRNAGRYTAVAVKLDNDNSKLPADSGVSQDYTIEKATPACADVTAALTYGQTLAEAAIEGAATDPTNGSKVSGSFEFSDGSVLPTVADSGTTDYPMTFRPEDTANYNEIPIGNYQMTVSKKALAVQMLSREKVYGDEMSAEAFVSYDASELVGTDRLRITPTATDANGAAEKLDPTYADAGTYTISADQETLNADNPNYAITVQDGSLQVKQRPVVLEWSDVSDLVYQYVDGVRDPDKWAVTGAAVTASVANLVKRADGTSDDCRVVVEGGRETEPSADTGEAQVKIYYASAVGLEGTASGNYTFSEGLPAQPWDITDAFHSSRLQPYVIRSSEDCIFPAVMIMTYGEAFRDVRMFAGSGNGTFEIVDEDNQSLPDYKPSAGTYQDTYKVKFTPSNGSGPSYGTSTLIVQKAPITVTAENASKTYGSGKPDYTWKVTGGALAEGDDLKALLTVKAVIYEHEEDDDKNSAITGEISGDEMTSAVNVYDIVLDEQLNSNYDLTFIGAKLTINPKEIEIVWSDTSNIVYGYVDGKKNPEKWREVGANVTAAAGGLVNGDICNLTCSGGSGINAGEYQAAVTGLDNPNYSLPSSGKTLRYEILKADPEAVFPDGLNAYAGNILGDLSFEAGADVPGTFAFEAADTVLEKSGAYKMIFTPDDLQNYNTAEAMVKVTVSERTDDANGGTGAGGAGGTGADGAGSSGAAAAGKTKGAETSDNTPILPYSLLTLLSFSFIVMMASGKKRYRTKG